MDNLEFIIKVTRKGNKFITVLESEGHKPVGIEYTSFKDLDLNGEKELLKKSLDLFYDNIELGFPNDKITILNKSTKPLED